MLDAPASRDDAVVQAIYGALPACTDSGLLRRIEPAEHPARFERRAGDNHHHLVCQGCGRTEDVDRGAGERPYLEPVDEHGFVIDEANQSSGAYARLVKRRVVPQPEDTFTRRNGSDRSTAQDDNRCRCAG